MYITKYLETLLFSKSLYDCNISNSQGSFSRKALITVKMENVAQGYYIDRAPFLLFVPIGMSIQSKEHNIFGITYAQPDVIFDVKTTRRR
jgi:hypothetical protein